MNDTPQSQEYIYFRNVMVWSALQMRLELVLGVTNLAKPVLQFLDKIFTGTSSSKGTYVVCVAFHALLCNNVFGFLSRSSAQGETCKLRRIRTRRMILCNGKLQNSWVFL